MNEVNPNFIILRIIPHGNEAPARDACCNPLNSFPPA